VEDDPAGRGDPVWAATAPELLASGGAYLEDCDVAPPTDDPAAETGVRPYAQDPDRAAALWERSEALVAAAG
jgi:hypothetical protein